MPGFDFSNHGRNAALQAQGMPAPKTTSTGTTIVGCIYDGGVVIAADTRATSGPIVADKNCEKLHYITPTIWCAGAGTAADTEFTTALISSRLELHALSTGRGPRVATCMTMLKQHLFRHQGQIGAYLVVAGVDATGVHLFTVHAHGSTDKLPYVTMGSGSLAAMAVFETGWRPGLGRDQAVALAAEAIMAGIFNDLGSGSNVDVCVIAQGEEAGEAGAGAGAGAGAAKAKATLLRNYLTPNTRERKMKSYRFARGTTAVLGPARVVAKEAVARLVTVHELGDGEAEQVGERMEVD
ncbi:MAG: proteasome core particle subunit beta 2 [Phylliscum demangeonii]|nr:MAG: proteasome core particle subunit beta 2 [Phylliscum demangeonii]